MFYKQHLYISITSYKYQKMVAEVILNWWAILVATIASFILGALWYGPVFGKYWMKLMNFDKNSTKKMKLTGTQAMGIGFVITIISVYILAHFVDYLEVTSIAGAAQLAFWLWLGIQVPVIIGSFLWEGRSFKLFLFNGAYRLIDIILITSILALWA